MKTDAVEYHTIAKAVNRLPMWLIQAILGVLLTGGVGWATWSTKTTTGHDTRIAVVETEVSVVKDDIKDIKDTQGKMNDKLDRIIDKLLRR